MHRDADSPVIDFGAHYLATETDQAKRYDELVGSRIRDPKQYLEWFEKGGFDGAVLSQPHFMGHPDREKAAGSNDDLWEVVRSFDEFYGLAALPIGAGGTEAASEFERCLNNGFHGGALSAELNGVDLVHKEVAPVLEVANQTGAPLFVHPTSNTELRSLVLPDEYQINSAYGREARLCGSISNVIHEGILDTYPNLTLIYHHYGGNIASMMGRIALRLDHDRWGRDLKDSGKSFEEFKAQLENRIYIDTSGYLSYDAPLRAALEQFPTSQILLGTDAPFEPRSTSELQEYVTNVRKAVPRSESKRILGENALDLLVNTH